MPEPTPMKPEHVDQNPEVDQNPHRPSMGESARDGAESDKPSLCTCRGGSHFDGHEGRCEEITRAGTRCQRSAQVIVRDGTYLCTSHAEGYPAIAHLSPRWVRQEESP